MTAQDLFNLGARHYRAGQLAEAESLYRRALALDPQFPAWKSLADTLYRLARFDEAIAAYQQSLVLQPDVLNARLNLGDLLTISERYVDAVSLIRETIAKWPECAEAHAVLGTALYAQRQYEEAQIVLERAVELDPKLPNALNSLGNVLKDIGQIERAVDCYQRAVTAAPKNAVAHSNLVYAIHFDPRFRAAAIGAENRRWDASHGQGMKQFRRPLHNAPLPNRRLRIGYVSPDFREQAESFFTIPLLESHDHSAFEIYCYCSVSKPDRLTERIRRSADAWREVAGKRDEDVAEIVRQDRIDILIDLTMHMAGNRAKLFACKPAPVQACWLAYPGGTGLEAMDFRITDSFMDPMEADTSCYTEKSVRLAHCWAAYDPLIDIPPRQPEQNGPITFGSLNNPAKLNEGILKLWASLMRATPGSRLFLQLWSEGHRRRVRRLMESEGVGGERIDFAGWMERPEYLRLYDRLDIALDPLPYNGITTTCDALYMGVPVLTLTGATAAGRAGAAILSTIGLGELISRAPDEFIRKGVELAGDVARLVEIRRGLRARLIASPLADGARFARQMEAAYRQMWREWCSRAP